MSLGTNGPSVSAAAPARGGAMRDLMPRLISAIVMVILALGTAIRGGEAFILFWLAASLAVVWEWQRLIAAPQATLRFIVGAVALVLTVVLARQMALDMAMLTLLIGCGLLAWLGGPGKRVWAAAGLVYASSLAVSVTLLRLSLFEGLEAILFLFAVVWGTDVCAYFGGRLIGGPKLWPRVSPSKTWSGFLVGITSGAFFGTLLYVWISGAELRSVVITFLIGLICGAVSQGGDLFESSVKRHFGVKDSSHLIPGHGGFMDRLDGFIFACALAALVGFLRSGPAAAAIGLLRW